MRNSTSFKTITAKYSGSTCRRCNQPIAVGESFRYGGPGRTYHLADRCQNGALAFVAPAAVTDAPTPQPTPQQLMSATIASSLQQTFSSLLAQPARIGDVEARIIAPGHPERSVMYWRLTHRGFGQMPPLSVTTIDEEAVKMFEKWIWSLKPPP